MEFEKRTKNEIKEKNKKRKKNRNCGFMFMNGAHKVIDSC